MRGSAINKIETGKLNNRKLAFRIIIHILGWLILLIVPLYLFFGDSVSEPRFLIQYSAQIVLLLIIFYINYLWLAPACFFRGRTYLYGILLILMISVSAVIHRQTHRLFDFPHQHAPDGDRRFRPPPELVLKHNPGFRAPYPEKPKWNYPTYNFVLLAIFSSGMGLGLRFSEKLSKNEKQKEEIERLKLNAELAFLKNQISPHFFFNTLNNIYSLVEYDKTESQKAILELSKLMRYLLYETSNERVKLVEEIDFLKNYFELMKLRVNETVDIQAEFPDQCTDIFVPPLLFLPFVENAFKHGITYREPSFIEVQMKSSPGTINFTCKNSIGMFSGSVLTESGIGLENVRKRLDLLFPGKHNLLMEAGDKIFKVELTLDLS